MEHSPCPPESAEACRPASCQTRCALEVIDDLLRSPGAATGEEADRLLDLRWKLHQRIDAEGALRLFCDLRLSMERRHYVALFRVRRWLENHLLAEVRSHPNGAPQQVPVKLDHYCVEAIRRTCLCAGIDRAEALLSPRLTFVFRASAAQPAERSATGSVVR